MSTENDVLDRVALRAPTLLLPAQGVDLSRWAVVACDQYTSQPDYWNDVEAYVGDAPSTLNVIFPEIYLEEPNPAERIKRINAAMTQYVAEGTLREVGPAFMLIERAITPTHKRLGLVVSMDLDRYDYRPEATSLIRATEGTIVERLPPRMDIRRRAAIELPHIMVLIDDPEATVIEPLMKSRDQLARAYAIELMKEGGHLSGFLVDRKDLQKQVGERLAALATPAMMKARYGVEDRGVLLFAMGDGNHSLATAKAIWEERKAGLSQEDRESDPARHALVELVNIHDAGLAFEPIHRVLFNVDVPHFWTALTAYFQKAGATAQRAPGGDDVLVHARTVPTSDTQTIAYASAEGLGTLRIENAPHTLAVGSLQGFLDEYLADNRGTIDYVHGESVVRDLAGRPGTVGFFLPPFAKSDLFKTVMRDGPLPRKAFSMGEAHEKRFYMEARRITR